MSAERLNAALRDAKAVEAVFGPPDYSECPELRPVPTPVVLAAAAPVVEPSAPSVAQAIATTAKRVVDFLADGGWAIRPASASSVSASAVLV